MSTSNEANPAQSKNQETNLNSSVQIRSTKLTTEQVEKLTKLINSIPDIIKKLDNKDYDEIFGYRINIDTESHVDVPVRNEILLKFLIANDYSVETTIEKLIKTLNWRNKFKPLAAGYEEEFDPELDTLGAITKFDTKNKNLSTVTWNFYGNLKSPKKLFEQFGKDEDSKLPGNPFLRWRIGLMERSLLLVDYTDPNNHKIAQVHDYNNVSMFKIDPGMKAATKEIITIFGDNYPELLSTKFFINVPTLMSWVFGFFKTIGIISEETLKKFQVQNNGNLSEWFGKDNLPKEYNGGAKNEKITSLSDNEKALKLQITCPKYGELILKNSSIESNNLSVE